MLCGQNGRGLALLLLRVVSGAALRGLDAKFLLPADRAKQASVFVVLKSAFVGACAFVPGAGHDKVDAILKERCRQVSARGSIGVLLDAFLTFRKSQVVLRVMKPRVVM